MTTAVVAPASKLPHDAPSSPVAIVGAGACGLTAAIALREAGVECVLLERDASPQGSTALSSGFIPAALTRWQVDAGVDDSAEAFASDITHKARGQAAAHLVLAYTQASAAALHMLHAHGLVFELLDGFLYPGHALRRMHCLAQRTGAALVAALEQAAHTAGADLLTQARVTTLYADAQGQIHGLGYERPDGSLEHLRCGQLLLANNGFGGNAAMVAELLPEMRDAPFAGHVGNDGSAIAWGQALGAARADLGGYQGHGSWVVPQGTLMTWAVLVQGGIQVNRKGERFHDETQGYSEAAVHVLAQPDGLAWNLFDDPLLELARSFPDFRAAEAAGALRSAADSQALAGIIGCDASVLKRTLDAIDPQSDDRWGRRFERGLQWPIHAVKVTGALFHTQGGLDIDADCRVRREDGTVFPNLWAAGGAARGVSGNAVWGYLSGNGLLSAVAGGYLAARSMAELPGAAPGTLSGVAS